MTFNHRETAGGSGPWRSLCLQQPLPESSQCRHQGSVTPHQPQQRPLVTKAVEHLKSSKSDWETELFYLTLIDLSLHS